MSDKTAHMQTDLLCFQHLSESRFLLGTFHKSSTFAIVYHSVMQSHLL